MRRHYTPQEYQHIGTAHLLDVPRCALWAGMGMGKTVTTLTALDALYMSGESAPTLVLAPLPVARDTWPGEVKKWEHLRGLDIVPIIGTQKQRLEALRYESPVYTINYDNLVWLVEHFGDKWPFGTVVADESTRLKSLRLSFRRRKKKDGTLGKEFVSGQGGKRPRALGKIAHTHIKRFVQLTGTPSPNGLKDLWGQIWLLDGGVRLGRTYEAFMQRWFEKGYDGYGVKAKEHAQEQIHERLRDICLTLDPKDYFDLDDPLVRPRYVELPVKARHHYREMEKQMFTELAEDCAIEAVNTAARTMKCLQIANGAAYVDDSGAWQELHDAKLQALESVVEEAAGMPVLTAYHFKSDRERIMRAFGSGVLDLSTPEGLTAAKAGRGKIWLGHPASVGHGVDGLQYHSNIVAFFGHWWDLEQYQQIIERVGPVRQRQAGFDRPTWVYPIVARDTVDELVMERRESKREVQDILLEAMKRRRD